MDAYESFCDVGHGSFGRVVKARHRRTGELVALKIIPKLGKSPADIQGLRNECDIQRKLNHPNIVRMLDAFETGDEIVVVAEYVPGLLTKLHQKYTSEGVNRMPEDRVQQVATDLLKALYYLHEQRILHRDIKPQNVLIDSQERAKLCDFGFARFLDRDTFLATSTKGTPLYMAPEVIEAQPYDQKADLWSVGCILYELLVGAPPFHSHSLGKLVAKVRHDSIPMPDGISPECKDFLQGLLVKESRQRMDWPEIQEHPFLNSFFRDQVRLLSPEVQVQPLTEPLSDSQLLAKEIERQTKARNLAPTQNIFAVAQKHQETQAKIAAMKQLQNPDHLGSRSGRRRSSDTSLLQTIETFNANRRYSELAPPPTRAQHGQPPAFAPSKEAGISRHADEDENSDSEQVYDEEQWMEWAMSKVEEVRLNVTLLSDCDLLGEICSPLKSADASASAAEGAASILMLPFLSADSNNSLPDVLSAYSSAQVVSALTSGAAHLLRRHAAKTKLESLDFEAVELIVTLLVRLGLSDPGLARGLRTAMLAGDGATLVHLAFQCGVGSEQLRGLVLACVNRIAALGVDADLDRLIGCVVDTPAFQTTSVHTTRGQLLLKLGERDNVFNGVPAYNGVL